jgi:hypothetical protein
MNLHDILGIVEKTRWMGENSPIIANIRYSNPKVCVITGPNVSGKSLLRKIINVHHRENKVEFIHLSQAGRCESGIMKSMIYGNEQDDSTGYNTLKTMLTAIKTGISRENSFTLFFDEPEIGCSESRALTSSLFRLGGTQGVSGLRALRNPAVPPLSEWKKEGNVRSVEIGDTTYAIVALSGVNKGILSTVYRRGVKGGELGRSLLLRDARALAVTHAGQ